MYDSGNIQTLREKIYAHPKQYDALMPALERQMDTDHYGEYTISIFTLIHRISSWSDNPLKNRNIKKSCV